MRLRVLMFILAASSLLLTGGAHAAAPSPAKAPYVPQETRVALLPVVDATGGKAPNDAAVNSARVSLGRQIVGRGFKVVPAPAVTAALSSLKLTLTDQTPRTPEALLNIGAAVQARLVVFVVVTQADTPAGVKVWVLDTKTHTFILDGKAGSSKSEDADEAVSEAVEAALADFLKPYEEYDC